MTRCKLLTAGILAVALCCISTGIPAPARAGVDELVVLDFLNDDEPPPHAFNVGSGTLAPGARASFQVYHLYYWNDGGNTYYDMSYDFTRARRGRLTVKARAAPGSRSVAGRLFYDSEERAIVYVPNRRMRVPRTALLSFEYRWNPQAEPIVATFTLQIPAHP
jgi:hypothetical protein